MQFSWLLLCLDLDDEELSNELLKYVVEMWLTIRGFSMANTWMEYYKQSDEFNTKSKTGLRKGMKRKKITTRRGLYTCYSQQNNSSVLNVMLCVYIFFLHIYVCA